MCFWITMIVLLILLITTPPTYPYSRTWGYSPVAAVLLLIIVLWLLWWFAWLPAWYYPVDPVTTPVAPIAP